MKTTNHNQIHKKLIFYLEGQLSESERRQVEEHLSGCADCASYFNELKSSLLLLDENKLQEPGPYFYAGVKNRIQARCSKSAISRRVLQPALLVLLLAMGVRFGVWVGNHTRIDLQTSEQAVLMPFDDLAEEPIEEFLLNLK